MRAEFDAFESMATLNMTLVISVSADILPPSGEAYMQTQCWQIIHDFFKFIWLPNISNTHSLIDCMKYNKTCAYLIWCTATWLVYWEEWSIALPWKYLWNIPFTNISMAEQYFTLLSIPTKLRYIKWDMHMFCCISCNQFTHMLQGCFTDTKAIICLWRI